MKKSMPAVNPDAYLQALDGWRRKTVEALRSGVCAGSTLEEVVKWGHLVYLANGPVLLIRAEDERVLFGHKAFEGNDSETLGHGRHSSKRGSESAGRASRSGMTTSWTRLR